MYLSSRIRPQLSRQIRGCAYTTVSSSIKQDTDTIKPESETGQSPPVDSDEGRGRQAFLDSVSSPEPRALGNVYTQWSPNIHTLFELLREHVKTPYPSGLVPPGYHQVSHKMVSRQWLLDKDGAELRHAPGPDYKFRVWSGGTMQFSRPFIPRSSAELLASERFQSCKKYRFGARVNIIQDFGIPKGVHELPPAFESAHDAAGPIIIEEKRLAFFKEIPQSLKTKDDMVGATPRPVPYNPVARQVVLPTPALLFYFSALTLNAHAIHLDREFTKSVYGIPDLLVHGPLTSLLMLELLRKHFARLAFEGKCDYFIKHFKYNNHRPLWVNEEITIGCKQIDGEGNNSATQFRLSDRERQTNSKREFWYLWISKGTGDKATIAVDGTAIVSRTPYGESPLQKWRVTREDAKISDGVIPMATKFIWPFSQSKNSDDSDTREPASSNSANELHPNTQEPKIPIPSEDSLESTTSTAEAEPHQQTPVPPPASETFNFAPTSPSEAGATSTESPTAASDEVLIRRTNSEPRKSRLRPKARADLESQSQTPSSTKKPFRIRHILG